MSEQTEQIETNGGATSGEQIIDESRPHGAMRLVTLSGGTRVTVKRMSPNVLIALNASTPEPPPPVTEIERPDGTKENVANALDPDYQRRVAMLATDKNRRVLQFACGLYVKLWNEGRRGLTDEQREELSELAEAMQAENAPLPGRSDEARYILNCAITSPDDFKAVSGALFSYADDPK